MGCVWLGVVGCGWGWWGGGGWGWGWGVCAGGGVCVCVGACGCVCVCVVCVWALRPYGTPVPRVEWPSQLSQRSLTKRGSPCFVTDAGGALESYPEGYTGYRPLTTEGRRAS